MREIHTKSGVSIIVDDCDFELLASRNWFVTASGYVCSAAPTGKARPRQLTVRMHRLILGLKAHDPRQVDHINGNKLDNRRENLRVCTVAENARNKAKTIRNRSGFKGVCWHPKNRKWQSQIKHEGRMRYLGQYDNPELAHEVYCLAADMLHGEFANHGLSEN